MLILQLHVAKVLENFCYSRNNYGLVCFVLTTIIMSDVAVITVLPQLQLCWLFAFWCSFKAVKPAPRSSRRLRRLCRFLERSSGLADQGCRNCRCFLPRWSSFVFRAHPKSFVENYQTPISYFMSDYYIYSKTILKQVCCLSIFIIYYSLLLFIIIPMLLFLLHDN